MDSDWVNPGTPPAPLLFCLLSWFYCEFSVGIPSLQATNTMIIIYKRYVEKIRNIALMVGHFEAPLHLSIDIVDCGSSDFHLVHLWGGLLSQNRDSQSHLHNHQHPDHTPDLSPRYHEASHQQQHCGGGQGGIRELQHQWGEMLHIEQEMDDPLCSIHHNNWKWFQILKISSEHLDKGKRNGIVWLFKQVKALISAQV